jgi:hypothetical protein
MADAQGNDQQFQDALSQLFASIQNPNQQPSPTLLPGMPGAPPVTSNLPANGARSTAIPFRPMATPAAPPPVAPTVPKPSDDPALSMPALPPVPTFQAPDVLNKRIATRTGIEDVNRAHANDARDNKPHWYDRLLGGVTGAVVGGLTGNEKQGAEVGGKVTNRAFNRADTEKQRELSPLLRELNSQKEDEPFYTRSDKAGQDTFEDKFKVAKEGREQQTATANAEYKSDLNDIKQSMADNKHEEALSRIQEMEKRLDEKKDHDKDWLGVQNQLLELRKQTLELKEKKGAGKKSGNLSDKIQKDKDAGEARAKREYDQAMAGISDKNSPEALEARQSYIQKMQASQNSYEQRIEGQGGEPEHVEYDENGVAKDNSGNPVGPARSAAPPSNSPGPAAPAKTAQPAASVEEHTLTAPNKPGTPLTDKKIAKQYLDAAKGDKAKARELAKADGWKF